MSWTSVSFTRCKKEVLRIKNSKDVYDIVASMKAMFKECLATIPKISSLSCVVDNVLETKSGDQFLPHCK